MQKLFTRSSLCRFGCIAMLLLVATAVGCASKDSSARGTDEFEKMKDPPLNAQTHFAAGQLAESQNNVSVAVTQYELARQRDHKHEGSLYRLGVLYSQMKNYPKAIEAWKDYASVTKESPTAMSNLGFCCELAGRNDEAEAAYKKGISKDPKNQPCRINYGLMLARNGHINEAMQQLQSVLPPAEVHYNLASVYQAQGRKEQARQEYQKAVELNPAFTDAKNRLADVSN
jgi:tetratricopeptide (TPR) repeat protein